jgi:hypothetical protein
MVTDFHAMFIPGGLVWDSSVYLRCGLVFEECVQLHLRLLKEQAKDLINVMRVPE